MAGMSHSQILEADLTWTGERFERSARVAIDANGRIAAVGNIDGPITRRLHNRALLPGYVNVHSHAFQRGLRGRGERFPPPEGAGSFWTWREAMYTLVNSLDREKLLTLTVQAFNEMLAAGITTVGEFHYVHHDASQRGFTLDDVILDAAAQAGIRLVFLNTYYKTGGVDQPLKGGQLRFRGESVDEYWGRMDVLSGRLKGPAQTLGAVAHSIRAVPIEDIIAIHAESLRRNLVFHMHVEEQKQEIQACVDRYGKTPMALFNESLTISPLFTAIHCTHTAAADLDEFIDKGGNIGICPLSEANLGDGIANLPRMMRSGACACIGTDANTRLCMNEELRWLEYVQRLAREQRGCCMDESGNVAKKLFEIGTINGARSLGLRTGKIEPRMWADLLAVDLNAPALAGWDENTLLDAFILGTGNSAIREVCVGGRWVR
ncbi:MAG TPA: formimidoylglutamate deiminase [Phycisphaerales bacterium]|nr:formimidoylglutamate deiminase [Phycisphaerales bacterium]